MKKIHFQMFSKVFITAVIGAGAFLLASCAGDGFDEESFTSGDGVTNTKLTTPPVDKIKIERSTDGSKQTISWPVVYGAGGYKAVLTNLTTNVVMVDTIIDNLSFATSRDEDTNYLLVLKVLGNSKLGNTDGEEVSKPFNSFSKTFKTIPAGDLNAYFEANPIHQDSVNELNYDLEPGKTYTLSKPLNFNNPKNDKELVITNFPKVTLRSTDKNNPATINVIDNETSDGSGSFVISNDFGLKYVNINMNASTNNSRPLIELYKYDGEGATMPDGILQKPNSFYIINAVNIISCNIKGVPGSIIYDNNMGYAILGLTFKNTLIEAKSVADKIKNQAFISFQGGGVKDFTMSGCTVYQKGEKINKYFLRYNNSVRVDRITGLKTDFTTFTWTSNTFYNLLLSGTDGQWFNSNGPKDYSTYMITNNIWVDCSKQIARRIKGNSQLGTNSTATFQYNTYWDNNEPADQAEHDASGTILTTDPAFVDAANGDFTPTGAEQLQHKTGDPRWYKE